MSFGIAMGLAFSANLLTFYLFYELLTLGTLPLVMHAMNPQAQYAGKKYIVYSIGGAAFAFIAMVFMMYYGTSLDFTFGGVLDMLQVAGHEQWLLVVFVLAFFGFGQSGSVSAFRLAAFSRRCANSRYSIAPCGGSCKCRCICAGTFNLLYIRYRIFKRKLGAVCGDVRSIGNNCLRFFHGATNTAFKTQVGVFNGKQPFLYGIWFDTDDSCGYGRRFDPYGGSLHFKNSCILLCGRHSL